MSQAPWATTEDWALYQGHIWKKGGVESMQPTENGRLPEFLEPQFVRRLIGTFPALDPTWPPERIERWLKLIDRVRELASEADRRMVEVMMAVAKGGSR